MIVALAQCNFQIGNLIGNEQKIIECIKEASLQQADLIVFAEMAIGGYPAKDLWNSDEFILACEASLNRIAMHTDSIGCVIGFPALNLSVKGKRLRNSAALLYQGRVQQIVNKSLIPDYDVFDEYRYFESAESVSIVEFQGVRIALTICEDLWDDAASPMYKQSPMHVLRDLEPDLLINIAASPFAVGQLENRIEVLSNHAKLAKKPVLYLNQVGAQADLIFDGHSMAFQADGTLIHTLSGFDEALQVFELRAGSLLPKEIQITGSEDVLDGLESMDLIYRALVFGVRDYFEKMGFKTAVIGLSGGLDSALVTAIACAALGPEHVYAVLMPSRYSSDHSIQDALDLVRNTGCHHCIVPIEPVLAAFDQSLSPVFNSLGGLTEENIQARIRGTLLMAFSNQSGHILLNTSNKSESAVGYGTLYGDMAGSLSVIGDLFKTDAYSLARYINLKREIIPINTIIKPPSAELRPDQKDSDSLPDYAILDAILKAYIEEGMDKNELIDKGYAAEIVHRILKLVDRAEFKRFQSPPVLRISKKAFGPGRVHSLVANKNY